MRRVFVSDLHLGDRSAAEDFHQTLEFSTFLGHYVKNKIDELFIVGDLFELWQTTFQSAIVAHREPIAALRKMAQSGTRVIYIVGNHDYWFSYFKDPYPILFDSIVESHSTKERPSVWVEHGHVYDMYNRTGAWTGKIATALAGVLERTVDPDIDDNALTVLREVQENFRKIIRFITPADPSYPGNMSEYEKAAESKLLKENYDVVVFGHTHKAKIKEFGKRKIYANTGTWVRDIATFVEVSDTEVFLYTWKEGRAKILDKAKISGEK